MPITPWVDLTVDIGGNGVISFIIELGGDGPAEIAGGGSPIPPFDAPAGRPTPFIGEYDLLK